MPFTKVRMVLGQIVVTMEHNLRILSWPGEPAGHGADQREARKDCEGGGLPEAFPRKTSERISNEPACMTERELCGEEGRAILVSR